MPDSISLLIADDHELVRLALQHSLYALADAQHLFAAEDAGSTQSCLDERLAAGAPVSVALIDWRMPGVDGVAWFKRLIAAHPATRIVVMSGAEDATMVRDLLAAGAAGFIPKTDSAAVILQAMRLVLAGGVYAPVRLLSRGVQGGGEGGVGSATKRANSVGVDSLTERQLDVLRLLAKGLPNKLIARELDLSEGTIKVHLLAIFRTLNVSNRTEAVIAASAFLNGASGA
jgi:DNA-binding NarL/FixJ family response regulator